VLLSVVVNGSGRVSAAGIDCGQDCQESLPVGQEVVLTATPAAGQTFDGWGGACQGVEPTCRISLQSARTAVASFVAPRMLNEPVDALIAAMPANSWKRLPGTPMADACPQPYQSYFCGAVIGAWSGGAYDERRDRMVVYGGGHSDSYYNNVFAFDLGPMRWTRLSEMGGGATGNLPGLGWANIALESCGFYPKAQPLIPSSALLPGKAYVDPALCFTEPILSQLDLQQPRSSHSYGKVLVDAKRDRYCYIGGGNYPSAQTDSYVPICFDPHSRTWEREAERPYKATGRGTAQLDAAGDWWYLTDGNANILRYTPSSRRWTEYGNINYEASGQGDIDRRRGHFYVLATRTEGGYRMVRFDLNDEAALRRRPAYSEVATSGMPTNIGSRPGFVYADARDRFYAWGGGGDVYSFDPQTDSWSQLKAGGDVPGAQQPNGTYGRWRYSALRKVFVLVNAATQDVYLYKP
jgi:hypothetical protein